MRLQDADGCSASNSGLTGTVDAAGHSATRSGSLPVVTLPPAVGLVSRLVCASRTGASARPGQARPGQAQPSQAK